MKRGRNSSGFTIVELVIVIIVIAILTMIVATIFANTQKQARDTHVRASAHKIAEAVEIWSANNDRKLPPGGSGSTTAAGPDGCVNGQSGWLESGIYICSVEDTLVAAGLITPSVVDEAPKSTLYGVANSTRRFTYMLYGCGASKALLYYTLEDPTDSDLAAADAEYKKCMPSSNFISSTHYVSYGMRGVIYIEL